MLGFFFKVNGKTYKGLSQITEFSVFIIILTHCLSQMLKQNESENMYRNTKPLQKSIKPVNFLLPDSHTLDRSPIHHMTYTPFTHTHSHSLVSAISAVYV